MYRIKTEASFDSAHFLYGYPGKCRNIHGHTWRVSAEICSESLSSSEKSRGMVCDFTDLKSALRSFCDELDHCLIYETGTLAQAAVSALTEADFRLVEVPFRPTAENIAKYFFEKLGGSGFPVSRVEVFETHSNSAVYEEEH